MLLTTNPKNADDTCTNMLGATKVADFGTVRADNRAKVNDSMETCAANLMTHAQTNMVIGTGPYMPTEYFTKGHVSEKTDSFAFGIVLIELLTCAHPQVARDLADEDADLSEHPMAKVVGWPSALLEDLSAVAKRCTRNVHRRRSTIAKEICELEALLCEWAGGTEVL